jgi:hypothetical protein
MNEDYELYITEYLTGQLDLETKARFEAALKEDQILQQKVEFASMLAKHGAETEIDVPSDSLRSDFLSKLSDIHTTEPKERTNPPIIKYLVAASISGLIGLVFGITLFDNDSKINELSDQINQLRQSVMIAEMNHTSPVNRLISINSIETNAEISDEVLYSLSNRITTDPNINVRIAAIQTLASIGSDTAKATLEDALIKEKEPSISIILIEIVSSWNQTIANEKVDELMDEDRLDDSSKNLIKRLKSI